MSEPSIMTTPATNPRTKGVELSVLCRRASGNSSISATVVMIPATNASTLAILSSESSFSFSAVVLLRTNKATNAPSGSASPEMVANQKARHGEFGRAARHGTAIATPSGILWSAMATVVVIPSSCECMVLAATANPSGKLCTAKETNKSMVTRQARRALAVCRSFPLEQFTREDHSCCRRSCFSLSEDWSDRASPAPMADPADVGALLPRKLIDPDVLRTNGAERLTSGSLLLSSDIVVVVEDGELFAESDPFLKAISSSNPKISSGSGKAHLDKRKYRKQPIPKPMHRWKKSGELNASIW
mmetsp:Transcript_11816/g.32764  ORF Transcript_11816/g.32764 Transcript_11816/m.32764 type:complete len:302 (-) Transcript_11816:353-1258(-)